MELLTLSPHSCWQSLCFLKSLPLHYPPPVDGEAGEVRHGAEGVEALANSVREYLETVFAGLGVAKQ